MIISCNRSLPTFAKLVLIIQFNFILWSQFSSEFRCEEYPTIIEEEPALRTVAENLKFKRLPSSTSKICHDSDLGIQCDCNYTTTLCRIKEISWSNQDLYGILPEAVANLTYLEKLDLSYNKIGGNIPSSLGKMSSLYYLDLSNNQLTGGIPHSLGNLKAQIQEDEVWFDPNKTMSKPESERPFSQSNSKLKPGDRNKYSRSSGHAYEGGPVFGCRPTYNRYCDPHQHPPGYKSRTRRCPLFNLDLASNNLEGPIPESLGNIRVLGNDLEPDGSTCNYDFSIHLHFNLLTGVIPSTFGKLKYLKSLKLRNNMLSGPIPSTLGNMLSINLLFLRENQLNDSLPKELGQLTSLQYLSLQSNYFTGELPSTFANLTNLAEFSISGNYLSGAFPSFITKWTSIQYLSLYGNNFDGEIPSNILNFSRVINTLKMSDLATTSFRFPKELDSPYLSTLILRNCSLVGPIPAYIANMSSLQYLDLSFNKLEGEIPGSLQNLSLIYMSFANNSLSGPIPEWIFRKSAANNWTKIDLSFNHFSEIRGKKHPNLNLFFCCPNCPSTKCRQQPEMVNMESLMNSACSDGKPKQHSLYINCGGEEIRDMDENEYDEDNSTLSYGVRNGSNSYWAFSSTGSYLLSSMTNSSDQIKKVKCGISVAEAPLYEKARLAPVSLKYYAFCLHNGTYNITLHFAEIVYNQQDVDSQFRLNKRIFDIYIQGNRVETNFNINKTAGGPNRVALVENHTVYVNNSQLEIHLYWAGKGSTLQSDNNPDFNGPLLSAISVTPGFKLRDDQEKLSRSHKAMITLGSITFALVLFLVFASIMGWLEKEALHVIKVGGKTDVTLKQLIAATKKFSKEMEIGKGAFGTVYKAEFPDHYVVAVKKLDAPHSVEGIDKLKSEIEIFTLQSWRHDNLVRLFDIYVGKGLYLLIYEYMENKSLAEVLFNPESKVRLNWDARFNICLGIAKALEYSHEHPKFKTVHRGIKVSNILLDGTLNSKLSDFGLASFYADTNKPVQPNHGYMAPEYLMYGTISREYDVYGFGMVILELVSGRKNGGPKKDNYNQDTLDFLVNEVVVADKKGALMGMVDKSLNNVYETKQAMTILKLAVSCTNISPGVRPTMANVVSVLTGQKTLDQINSLEVPAETEQDLN